MDHAPRCSLDLAFGVGDVVAAGRFEDLDLAGGSPLHCSESVSSGLRVPQHGGLATSTTTTTTVLHSIEESCSLLLSQRKHFGDECGLLVALGIFQAVHGCHQGLLSSGLVGGFLLDHLPVYLPPVLGILWVHHFALGVANVALDQCLPEGSGAFGNMGAGDLDIAELLWVVYPAENWLDGVVGQVGDVGDAADVADGGILRHGHERGCRHDGLGGFVLSVLFVCDIQIGYWCSNLPAEYSSSQEQSGFVLLPVNRGGLRVWCRTWRTKAVGYMYG